MAKIILCVLGTEGFGNIPIDKEVVCLEDMPLGRNTIVQADDSHGVLLLGGDPRFELF